MDPQIISTGAQLWLSTFLYKRKKAIP